jgi:predicted transcriptional regulator
LEKIKDKLLQSGYSKIDVYNAILQIKNKKVYKEDNTINIYNYNHSTIEKKFLQAVLSANNTQKGITYIYKTLNLSMRKGNKIKDKLLQEDYIELQEIKHETGWFKKPILTQKRLQLLQE